MAVEQARNMLNTERKNKANSTYPIGGVSCSTDSFVVGESLVLLINICAKNPAHRQAENRYWKKQKTNPNLK